MAPGWTQEDKARLFAFVEQFGAGNWTAAEKHVPGKTGKQCRDQWVQILSPRIKRSCNLEIPKKQRNVKVEDKLA